MNVKLREDDDSIIFSEIMRSTPLLPPLANIVAEYHQTEDYPFIFDDCPSCSVGKQIFIFRAGSTMKNVVTYNPVSQVWNEAEVPDIPTTSYSQIVHVSAIPVLTKIYLLGFQDFMYVLDTIKNTWTTKRIPLEVHDFSACCADDRYIFTFGGLSNQLPSRPTDLIRILDTDEDKWGIFENTLPFETTKIKLISCGGKIYLWNDDLHFIVFDPYSQTCKFFKRLPMDTFAGVPFVLDNTRIYWVTPKKSEGRKSRTLVYNIKKDTWIDQEHIYMDAESGCSIVTFPNDQ
jgi:hypothetical protein